MATQRNGRLLGIVLLLLSCAEVVAPGGHDDNDDGAIDISKIEKISEEAMEAAEREWEKAAQATKNLAEKEHKVMVEYQSKWTKQIATQMKECEKMEEDWAEDNLKLEEKCEKDPEKCEEERVKVTVKHTKELAKKTEEHREERVIIEAPCNEESEKLTARYSELMRKLMEELYKIQEDLNKSLLESKEYEKLLKAKELALADDFLYLINIQQGKYHDLIRKIKNVEEDIADSLCLVIEGDHKIMNEEEINVFNREVPVVLNWIAQRRGLAMKICDDLYNTTHTELVFEPSEHRRLGGSTRRRLARRTTQSLSSSELYYSRSCTYCDDAEPVDDGMRRQLGYNNGLFGTRVAKMLEMQLSDVFKEIRVERVSCEVNIEAQSA